MPPTSNLQCEHPIEAMVSILSLVGLVISLDGIELKMVNY